MKASILFTLAVFSLPMALFGADKVTFSAGSRTIDELSQRPFCTQAIRQVALRKFSTTESNLHVGVTRDLYEALHMFGLAEDARRKVTDRLSFLSGQVKGRRSEMIYLDDALAAMLADPDFYPYGEMYLWFCVGMNCSMNDSPTATKFAFNFTVKDLDEISRGADLSKIVHRAADEKIPYPAIGLSRLDFVLADKPDVSSDEGIDRWIAQISRATSVYASHQLISEWISKNHFGWFMGISDPKERLVDPIFEKLIRLEDRVYIIDQLFYDVVVSGSKYQAELAALKTFGRATASTEVELRQKAFHQVYDTASPESVQRFKDATGRSLDEEHFFEIVDALTGWMRYFKNHIVIRSSQRPYRDHSLGVMPMEASKTVDPPRDGLLPFPKPFHE